MPMLDGKEMERRLRDILEKTNQENRERQKTEEKQQVKG